MGLIMDVMLTKQSGKELLRAKTSYTDGLFTTLLRWRVLQAPKALEVRPSRCSGLPRSGFSSEEILIFD